MVAKKQVVSLRRIQEAGQTSEGLRETGGRADHQQAGEDSRAAR